MSHVLFRLSSESNYLLEIFLWVELDIFIFSTLLKRLLVELVIWRVLDLRCRLLIAWLSAVVFDAYRATGLAVGIGY